MRKVLITGTAGFIGFHLADLLLRQGWQVAGYDGMSDYYDVGLKQARHALLRRHPQFRAVEAQLEDQAALDALADDFAPQVIVHLAAQAGVRYSLEQPRKYVDSNVVGTFNVMEVARRLKVQHLLMASTSSVYGANEKMPFAETDRVDHPLTIYAATKKATEVMGHAYAHLWALPTTMFRFFTVYGPWGRPDMALFKFTDAALKGETIDVYNHGQMARDFTFIDDLIEAIIRLIPAAPVRGSPVCPEDSLSPVAPFRVVNIGNGAPVGLLDFITEIERAVGRPLARNNMDLQPGEVLRTWADSALLERLTGYRPATPVSQGVPQFVDWFRAHYGM